KDSDEINSIIKRMCFGNYISGVYNFHNAITQNINEQTKSTRKYYSILDFAKEWFFFINVTEDPVYTEYNKELPIPADKAVFYKAIILGYEMKTPWTMNLRNKASPKIFPVNIEVSNKLVAEQL